MLVDEPPTLRVGDGLESVVGAEGVPSDTKLPTSVASLGPGPETSRRAVEQLIDEIVHGIFPASDPPAWGVAASRLERSREADPSVGRADGEKLSE